MAELVRQVTRLGDISSKYRSCPATSPEGQAQLASQLVSSQGPAAVLLGSALLARRRQAAWQRQLGESEASSKLAVLTQTVPPPQVGMLVAMGCNTALLVKLADRLHDMRTLGALPAAKRNRLARETIDVWAPLANRLGVWSLKAQLEDLAFKQLFPAQVCASLRLYIRLHWWVLSGL